MSFDAFGDKELLKARIDAVASQGKRFNPLSSRKSLSLSWIVSIFESLPRFLFVLLFSISVEFSCFSPAFPTFLLSQKYQAEQREIDGKISQLRASLEKEHQNAKDAGKWIDLVKQYVIVR